MPNSQFVDNNYTDPDENSIVQTLESTYTRYQSVEQARWNEANIDQKFWAGDQEYIYTYYQFAPNYGWKKFFFNIIQQPANMITGYQRQHRKSFQAIPVEGSDQKTADQLNKCFNYAQSKEFLLETFSEACEDSLVTGFILTQPYLDFSTDFVNGEVKWKIWEYNSFIIDPYFRDTGSLSDCNFIWLQKYMSKKEALMQYPDHKQEIEGMSGYSTREGKFYFLPENYNIARNDLLVLSHYWFKSTRKKKMLYNRKTGETTEFFDTKEAINEYVKVFEDLEVVEREVPTWKVATVLNRTVLYIGENPLGFDECPLVPVYWNYDPSIPEYNLRVRSFVRPLRDTQYLFNRRILINHDISESTLNSGWMLEEDSLANPENLNYAGQGKNLEVKAGTARENWPVKIQANGVPASDMELANQLQQLMPSLTGVTQELLGMSEEKGIAGITQLLRQGAGLVTLQKYFDQWDRSLKQLGVLTMRIMQANWTPFKVSRIIGEEPTEQFFTRNFQKYDILPSEGLNTTIQKQQQFAQLLEFQQVTGIQIPPELLLKESTIQGKDELIEALNKQQQMQSAMAQQQQQLQLAAMESELENIKANTVEKLAMARERVGRTKSNIGLFDERISEMTKNRAIAIKEKVSSLKELLDTIQKYGEVQASFGEQQLQNLDDTQKVEESIEQEEGKRASEQESRSAGLPKNLQ